MESKIYKASVTINLCKKPMCDIPPSVEYKDGVLTIIKYTVESKDCTFSIGMAEDE